MAKISVQVQLVYTNRHTIPSTYIIDWNSSTRDFESFMFDLMNTLVTLEDESIFERADVLGIDVISGNELEKEEVKTWKRMHEV